MKTGKFLFNIGAGIDPIIAQAENYETNLYNTLIGRSNGTTLSEPQKQDLKDFLLVSSGVDKDLYDKWFNDTDDFILFMEKQLGGNSSRFGGDIVATTTKDGSYHFVPKSVIVAVNEIKSQGKNAFTYGWLEEAVQGAWAANLAKKIKDINKAGYININLTSDDYRNEESRLYDIELRLPDISLYTEVKYNLDNFHIGGVSGGLNEHGNILYEPLRRYLSSVKNISSNSSGIEYEMRPLGRETYEMIVKIDTNLVIPNVVYQDLGTELANVKFTKFPIYKSHDKIKLSSEVLKDLRDNNKSSLELEWDIKNEIYIGSGSYSEPNEEKELRQEAEEVMQKTVIDITPKMLKKIDLWYGSPQ